jgi:APA family basic amino acid/polyamine antiporter
VLPSSGEAALKRRRLGLSPKERHTIRREERPLDFLEVSYRSALVPIFGATVDTEAMRRAAAIARDAAVEALYVLRVPTESELDGKVMEQQEYEARCALDVARLQARARGLKVRARLIRTRNPGAAIVEEALERRSDLIYISTEHAPSEEKLLGPTTRYLLAKRPCRVIIESENGARRDRPGSAGPAHNAVGEPIPVS